MATCLAYRIEDRGLSAVAQVSAWVALENPYLVEGESLLGFSSWLWRGFEEIRILLTTNDLIGFGVGFGWLWAIRNPLIPGNFLALGVALGGADSKGLIGFV